MQITVERPGPDPPGGRVYISREELPVYGRNIAGAPFRNASRENGIEESLLQAMLACTPSRTMAAPLSLRDYTLSEEGDVDLSRAVPRCGPSGHRDIHQGISALKSARYRLTLLGITCCLTLRPISQTGGMCRLSGQLFKEPDKPEAYPVTLPLPGHRQAGDMKLRIRQLKEHHKKRLADCLRIVRELQHDPVKKPCLYDITGRMKWKIHCDGWDDFPAGPVSGLPWVNAFASGPSETGKGLVREVCGGAWCAL